MSHPKPMTPKARKKMPILLMALLAIIAIASIAFLVLVARLSVEDADLWLRPITGMLLLFTFVVGGAMLFTGYVVIDRLGEKVANAQTEASTAKRRADREAIKRGELEKSLSPRTLTLTLYGDGRSSIDSLKAFAGTRVIFEFLPEVEARRASKALLSVLGRAGWQVVSTTARPELEEPFFDGIKVVRNNALPEGDKAEDAAKALVNFLTENKWQANELPTSMLARLPANTIKIQVGFKPDDTYFRLVESREREIVRKRAHPRELEPEAMTIALGLLESSPKGPSQILCPENDEKACALAKQISELLKKAGWEIEGGDIKRVRTYIPPGITILARNDPPPIDSPFEALSSPARVLNKVLGVNFDLEVDLDKHSEIPAPFIGIWVGSEPKPEE